MKPDVPTKDLAHEIESFALMRGYKVNRRFCGHKIGKEMHERPRIYNTVEEKNEWGVLKVGEVYCIEPMLTTGKDNIGITFDGWTTFTQDRKPSAVFEHMIEITPEGAKVLTTHFQDFKVRGGDNL